MQVYEGGLLPTIFKGQPLHCDAGPNVVRGYITQPDGTGYKAEIENIMVGTRDKWFRPSDVCVAPDGSLIVADWYDPGVGGHGMGDTGRGRLFRVTTKSAEKYAVAKLDISSVDGSITALKSPNEATRYLAWMALKQMGAKAEPALKALFDDKQADPQHRARALWLLGAVSGDAVIAQLSEAMADDDARLNATGVRLARQLHGNEALTFLSKVAKPYRGRPVINREQAIALRFANNPEADRHWASIAVHSPATDPLLIEALGVGAELQWDTRLEAIKKNEDDTDSTATLKALINRSRGSQSPAAIARTVLSQAPGSGSQLRLLRALQLQPKSNDAAVAKAAMEIFLKADTDTALAATALLDRNAINASPEAKARLDSLLKPVIGTPAFIEMVQRLSLTGFEKDLLDYILAHPTDEAATTAGRLIAANRDGTAALLAKATAKDGVALASVLGRVGDRASVAVLNTGFWGIKEHSVKVAVIEALALNAEGGRVILKWQNEGKLANELKAGAALALSRSTDAGLRSQAAQNLPVPAALGAEKFPALPELLKLSGDASKGPAHFLAAGCIACHRVKGQFIDFGPDLSLIGSKLSKDGLFTAILYPSAAIEHSFNGVTISTQAGAQVTGYIISDTADELTLRIAGGAQQNIKKADITKREEMKLSLMPPGLAAGIGPQGLADLVAYLQALK
jgi:putative heme-binding domain-containing protein